MSVYVPEKLLKLAKLLPKPLYLVGGYVRNSLLTLNDTDIDIASELTPNDLRCLLLDTEYSVTTKSERMGTVLITNGDLSFEHTTFRQESYTNGNHQPSKVNFGVSINEDASRRDFTINALYYDIQNNTLMDFYEGVKDLENKIIKCVETPNYVFSADGLRILRMIRISSELGFSIDNDTLRVAKDYLPLLKDISGERKYTELVKMLTSNTKNKISPPNAPQIAIEVLNDLDAWQYILNLGKITIPKEYADSNIYKFFISIYSDHLQFFDITQFANCVFGKNALNRSNKEITMLKDLLYLEYCFKYDFVSLCPIYSRLDKIVEELKKFDNIKTNKLIVLRQKAIKSNIPLQIKELDIDPLELISLGISTKHLNAILKKLLYTVLTQNIPNKKQILIDLSMKLYEELK